MKQCEEGFSEVMDETLIIALGIACAVVVMIVMFGVLPNIQKSAYIVPLYGVKNVSGHSVITLFDRGGDPVYFNASPSASYRTIISVDTTAGTFTAVPAPGLNALTSGDLVYIYYTGSGFVITGNLNGTSVTSLPVGQVTVRMVDANTGTLISQEIVVKGTVTTPTANVTITTTATATPTATATVSTRTITVRWSPQGLGYGSLAPPAQLSNGQEVIVPRGSSKTIYFVPNINKAVRTIKLGGTTVYTGSSVGSTISYTISNIVEDREITATIS